jgi:hypothetical protein
MLGAVRVPVNRVAGTRLAYDRAMSAAARTLVLVLASACGAAPRAAPPPRAAPRAEPEAPPLCSTEGLAALSARWDGSEEDERSRLTEGAIDELLACVHGPPGELRTAALEIVARMADRRALGVLTEAIRFDGLPTEDAVIAARALRAIAIGDDDEGIRALSYLADALGEVSGDSGVENRFRIEALRTLGASGSGMVMDALIAVATTTSESQSFLINRLAFEQLGALGLYEAIPTLLEGLFLFDPSNPALRANDVAATALASLGDDAVPPLLAALAEPDAHLLELAGSYVEAVRARAPEVAASMDASALVTSEVAFVLGQIGDPTALDPLVECATALDPRERPGSIETDPADLTRQFSCALALVSIVTDVPGRARVREALVSVHRRFPRTASPVPYRLQMIVALEHLYDAALHDFFVAEARAARGADPDVRVVAARGAVRTALGHDLGPIEAIVTGEPEGDVRDAFVDAELEAALALHRACGTETACWGGHLHDPSPALARTAAAVLAGVEETTEREEATAALRNALDVRDESVFVEILYALDRVTTGIQAPFVVRQLGLLRDELEGTPFGEHVDVPLRSVRERLGRR